MKQTLILSFVITLLSGIYGYYLNAQESINPLVLCAETVTLKASPTRDLRSNNLFGTVRTELSHDCHTRGKGTLCGYIRTRSR